MNTVRDVFLLVRISLTHVTQSTQRTAGPQA